MWLLALCGASTQSWLMKERIHSHLDSKEPDWSKFRDFLLGEVRYLSVQKAYPNEADELFNQAEKMAKIRYNSYVRQTKMDWSENA
jgi:pyruvate-ferredoxin/flavodoxin oxidoreductase